MNKNPQGVRQHFSSVITDTLKGGGVLIVLFIFNFTDEIWNSETGPADRFFFLISTLVFVAVIALIFTLNLLRWLRTYTYFEDSSFVVCRNLIMEKKTTVKLSSIASINLKQGIFDRIFGTYTLQLDINSTVNASKTDFNLVFLKAYALELKELITNTFTPDEPADNTAAQTSQLIYRYPLSRVIRHGLLSTSLTSIVLAIALIIGYVADTLLVEPDESSSSIFAIIFIGQLIYTFLAPFFRYYDFTISREKGRVLISHGLISRSQYTLPLSKTNALILRQPLLARMFGLYYGEILNVGMGDEEKKNAPFFCLICNPQELHFILSQIAPEFIITALPESSPAAALLPVGFKYGGFAAALLILFTLVGLWPLGVAAFFFLFLCAFLSWRTKQINIQPTKLSITTGVFTKRIITVPYSRLQNIEVKRGPISSSLELCSGMAVILAEVSNKNNTIGYFPTERFDAIMQKMIEQRGSSL